MNRLIVTILAGLILAGQAHATDRDQAIADATAAAGRAAAEAAHAIAAAETQRNVIRVDAKVVEAIQSELDGFERLVAVQGRYHKLCNDWAETQSNLVPRPAFGPLYDRCLARIVAAVKP